MDGTQFDMLVRTGVTGAGRRQVLRALGAGLLGGFGIVALEQAEPTEAASSGCRPDCGPCGQCQPGKCKRKRGKKKCTPGKCDPVANGTSCHGTGLCLKGVCNARPTCAGFNASCIPEGDCCGGACVYFDSDLNWCPTGPTGAQCLVDTDCESASCVGYRCQ